MSTTTNTSKKEDNSKEVAPVEGAANQAEKQQAVPLTPEQAPEPTELSKEDKSRLVALFKADPDLKEVFFCNGFFFTIKGDALNYSRSLDNADVVVYQKGN